MRWNSADPPGNSADPPGNMKKEKENATERLAVSFFLFGDGSRRRPDRLFSFFRPGGLRTKIEFIGFAGTRTQTVFIGFAGSRTQTLQAPGPPFLLFPVPRFAYENRIHWLCGQSYANPAGTRATFSALSGAPVCVRKPNSLTLRALVRKPCRRPDHLFCSLVDRNRCKGLSTICRKMCRLGFQKIFCSYSDFASLCSRNSSECLFNSFS